ncbi:MAG: SpaA isopeptide-forming pilin-related protein [Bacilli bacterium]|nr:SpaA isopeptide-forming pilin-related protein [Bacilli bacterium]
MKKEIFGFLLSLISILGFSVDVSAAPAPSTIQAGTQSGLHYYVSGYGATVKKTIDGHYLFCDNIKLEFPANKTLTLGKEVNEGFVYMLRNQPSTGDTNKDFYILQMAVWWYKDIIAGQSNLSSTFKTNCTNNRNTNSTCGHIYNLVEGAKSYNQSKGTMSFSSGSVSFTEQGSYYISNTITITSNNLKTFAGVKLVGAPSGSSIINNNISNNNGTFQVKVPVSSVKDGINSFLIEASGTYNMLSAYDYYYSSSYQRAIYDVVYNNSFPLSISKSATITKEAETTTKTTTRYIEEENSLKIKKVDQNGDYLRNAELTLYKGDCSNRTCYTKNIYAIWTTTRSAEVFYDLPIGYYTLVETKTPEGYETSDKGLINIKRDDTDYFYTMINVKENENYVRISKTDITGTQEIPGATLIIKKATGENVTSWISTTSPKYIKLDAGSYTLQETIAPKGYKINSELFYFKVDNKGNVTVKNKLGIYVSVDYIKFVNTASDLISINKLDKNTNQFISGVILAIKNEKGEEISRWTTTNTSYNIALNPGLYILTELYTPEDYIKSSQVINFKVTEDGTVLIKNANGGYDIANGIIIYNEPIEEYETIVEVPKTGLSSTISYIIGTLTLVGGSWILIRNGKFN